MAVSRDGFIAGSDGSTPWSDDEWTAFQEFVKSCDACVMGRKTYEAMRTDGSFVDGPRYVVASHSPAYDASHCEVRSIQSLADMPVGNRVGIIGGGELNGSLAELGVINEVILDIEDVELDSGKLLFGSHRPPRLQRLGEKKIGPHTIQQHFKVISDNS